jgi:hypothetical protein
MAEPPAPATSTLGALWKALSTPWNIYGLLERVAKLDHKVDQLTEKVESLTERLAYLEGQIEHLLPHIDTKIRLTVVEALKEIEKDEE